MSTLVMIFVGVLMGGAALTLPVAVILWFLNLPQRKRPALGFSSQRATPYQAGGYGALNSGKQQ